MAAVPSMEANASAHDKSRWRASVGDAFTWTTTPEPHAKRRMEILKKHPEISELYKHDPWSGVFCLAAVALQICCSWLLRDAPWPVLLVMTYVVSGTLNHSNVLATHELSHDLWFKQKWANKWFAYFANLPTGIASAASFKRYHLEHHSGQGVDKLDADIPGEFEGWFFRTAPRKLLFIMFQPCFYALRPLICYPKSVSGDELVNWAVQASFDYLVLRFWGAKAFFYLIFGTFFGLGLHPMAGHFVAEHYEFISGQETYSYYGRWGNFFGYNVGYHNEHHDFPKVPGRLLPKLRGIAPEFYCTLPCYTSWRRVIYDFVFDQNMTCFCRIKRKKS